ncbi:hypothetical protein [Salinisphaera sp. Q1T1-3]|uniref:hypothetical protein n=1 Tax=Salinisphaera sp. Q1T1-3 TaxID=2321229 RepID=UPI001314873E|nr:hypothetical protein [Salinisphaera sp. Q1T1-3]
MKQSTHRTGPEAAAPLAVRERCYRRDFRLIYAATLAVSLLVTPVIRLLTIGRRRRNRRPSMLAQARSDAGLVASCALMGF